MNRDVLTEIFSYLPTQSLLRSRAVSKLWRDVIDSPPDAVYLQFRLPNDQNRKELLIELQHNGRSLMSYESDHLDSSALSYSHINDQVVLSGPAKGLICIYQQSHPDEPIAICNPFLGQVKLLPSSSYSSHDISWHEVSIGFDQDYKVVQMLWCDLQCGFVHAQIYCKRTNSWRELAGDSGFPVDLHWAEPIKSQCKDGHTLHWWAGYVSKKKKRIILSLDMKNEVFRTISLPDLRGDTNWKEIFAEDDHSFVLIVLSNIFIGLQGNMSAKVYKSRCKGRELSWNHVMDAEVPFSQNVPRLRAGCHVLLVNPDDFRMTQSVVYDYRARKFIGWHYLEPTVAGFVEYRGSLFSP